MHIRDYVIGFVVILLLVSTVIPVFSGSEENGSDSSVAPFKEFYEPNEKSERLVYEDTYRLTFNYTYMMDYDVVPENLVMILNGTCTSFKRYRISVNRPDDEDITLVNSRINETGYIDNILYSRRFRENIYVKMRSILETQEVNYSNPGQDDMAGTTKVLFGEVNEDLLVDPDPLKGEYEFIVEITGKDIEMKFGEKYTKLAILSEQSVSEPRNLEGSYKDGKVELEWDEPEEKEGGIRQYNIYRATARYPYRYIGNVSADKTEYVDEFEGEIIYHGGTHQQEQMEGDILFYTVVAISKDDYHYVVNSPRKRYLNFHGRHESMSLKEIVHLPYRDTEPSDMSYKWCMNYSSLSEDTFEDRVNMDSVTFNKMKGGDVFLYKLSKSGEENGKIVYEYEGGFFSKGEVDMDLEDGEDFTSNLNIEMNESWCDFSGKIWAKEISGSGYEALTIVKQTIHSEGQISASMNNTFDFIFEENQTHWEVSKEIDVEWTTDLTLDYEGNNSWIVSRENATFIRSIGGQTKFNYSGSIDAEGTLHQQSNHIDEGKKIEGEVSKDISGTRHFFDGSSAQGRLRTFSPLVGAGNIGYYLALDQGLNALMGSLDYFENPFNIAFSTNCQRDEFSTEKLYRYQYMDPMALPGLGSFLGTGLKRANLTNTPEYLEAMVRNIVRGWLMREEDVEDPKEWMENKTYEALGYIITETPWGIQQYNGIYRWDYYLYGGLVIEPLGYFASEPLADDELESYKENREEFFESQIVVEESEGDEDDGIDMMMIGVIVILGIILAIIGYMVMGSEGVTKTEGEEEMMSEETKETEEELSGDETEEEL